MESDKTIRCRVAACREALGDGNQWSFYLLNDNDAPIDSALLFEICYEWGDMGNSESANVQVTNLAPRSHALIWRDDGSGAELRMDLWLNVRAGRREVKLYFGFPKLYRLQNLPLIEGLGKHGWQVAAEG
jgi:hypothetical protein